MNKLVLTTYKSEAELDFPRREDPLHYTALNAEVDKVWAKTSRTADMSLRSSVLCIAWIFLNMKQKQLDVCQKKTYFNIFFKLLIYNRK